jgi:hypothetical protein
MKVAATTATRGSIVRSIGCTIGCSIGCSRPVLRRCSVTKPLHGINLFEDAYVDVDQHTIVQKTNMWTFKEKMKKRKEYDPRL